MISNVEKIFDKKYIISNRSCNFVIRIYGMITISEIQTMLETSDTVTVKFLYKKEAEETKRFFITLGYKCSIKANEFSNRNKLYFLTIKKQVK